MMKTLLRLLVLGIVVLGLGAGGAWFWLNRCFDLPTDPAATEPVAFEVRQGMGGGAVASALASAGYVPHPVVFRLYLRQDGRGGLIKAGTHQLSPSMNLHQIMDTLIEAPVVAQEEVRLLPGWTLRDADAALSAAGRLEAGAYLAAATNPEAFSVPFPLEADSLEGYLLPESYHFDVGQLTAEGLVRRQLETFVERFWEPNREQIAAGSHSLHDLVTVAAMVEREERNPANQPKVAGIIWKRLANDWALGIDATSRYPLDDWNDERAFRRALRDPDDPWNTRLRKGLPPGPISSPGLGTLEATLAPEEGPWWYYLHDSQGRLHLSRSAREHEAYRRRYNVY